MTANTPRTRKAKGRDFQVAIAEKLRNHFSLEERDIVSVPASVGGEDLLLSEAAKKVFPFSVECKCKEKLNIWGAIKQTEQHVERRNLDRIPLLIFKRNHTKVYACLEFEKLLELINV